MIDLNKKVFGDIRAREIFGSIPPAYPDTENMLDVEYKRLVQKIQTLSSEELKEIINNQRSLEKQVNSRPGAMALPQSKIKLYVDYNQKYIKSLEETMNNISN
ncbi:hypothetical protein C6988_04855 [Nitrosopumilus sp. b1]|uniref:hypothetical protein n=1 Tax=Nitrosopumilus sp. b1 TaxID=2109907 RepID=UPI0015F5DB9B|nr:hypothetical protein [Nitrosopumilus sp. b1]KAF6243025.1 hypothetical protein C6988_04855 [Nitrosopumilus sp. b1]